jgi:transcriptional regulator with XRE-family HTH domain
MLSKRAIMKAVKAPDHVDVQVGQRIRIQRLAIGMSQTILADALGVTFQQVHKYEKGVNRVGAGRLTKIASVLKVPVGSLLGAHTDMGDPSEEKDPTHSAFELLGTPGALRLLRAFSKFSNDKLRRSVLQLVERIAARRRK